MKVYVEKMERDVADSTTFGGAIQETVLKYTPHLRVRGRHDGEGSRFIIDLRPGDPAVEIVQEAFQACQPVELLVGKDGWEIQKVNEGKPTTTFEFEDEEAKKEFDAWFSNQGEQQLYEAVQHGPATPMKSSVQWNKEVRRYVVVFEEDERYL